MHKRAKFLLILSVLSAVLAISIALGISIGESRIPIPTVLEILSSSLLDTPGSFRGAEETIILAIRLPRVLLAAMIGASLAVSGAVLQSLFRNPMADPFILGISNGAALGASLVLLYGISLGLGIFDLPLVAFLSGVLTIVLVYEIARIGSRAPTNTLLLSGIAVSAFMGACTSFAMFCSSGELHQIIFWMMGGLSGRTWTHIYMLLPFAVIGIIVILSFTRPLNALAFGEESAQYLGVPVNRLKQVLLVISAVVTGAAVAVSGIIGFVGLITPHLVRLLTGPDHRTLLPYSALTGAIFLIMADLVARTIIAPAELPIGVITALCGAPFFIYLLRSRRREA